MPQDPHTDATADFRKWAENPANADDFDALVACFLADHGADMMSDLIGGSGVSMHRTASHYLSMLRERYETWLDQGARRIAPPPPPSFKCWTPTPERAVHDFLEANLPPGAVFEVGRRSKRIRAGSPAGLSETTAWFCKISDGPASAGAEGKTALQAARRAVEAWREFVTGSRVELSLDELSDQTKPPSLQAPSTSPNQKPEEEKRVS
jgi:hypothetical protein